MKVGILNFINAIIVSIVSLIAIVNSGAKFIFNSEYEQAIIGIIAAVILTINLVYLGTRLAKIFGEEVIFFPFLFITKPLILVKINIGIMVMPIAVTVAKLL